MLDSLFTNPLYFFIFIISLLIAITIHEFSHAWMANRLGDPTAKLMGRMSLNPFAHLDPIGTLALIFIGFGWGKPVPFDPFNLRRPRQDSALISLAGPMSNFILAILVSFILRFLPIINFQFSIINLLLISTMRMSVMLGVFNLLPAHPLDGGKILVGFLPAGKAEEVDQFLSQYGMIILLFLIFPVFGFSLVSLIVTPLINIILSLLLPGAPLT